jgi:hypothetical protein
MAEACKSGCLERSGKGGRRKKREATALGPMPNPLSGDRPAEPEPSGEGTANRDLVGTAMFGQAIGPGPPSGSNAAKDDRTPGPDRNSDVPEGDRKRAEVRGNLGGSPSEPTGAARPRPEPDWGPGEAAMRKVGKPERERKAAARLRSIPIRPAEARPSLHGHGGTTAGKWGPVATPAPITFCACFLGPVFYSGARFATCLARPPIFHPAGLGWTGEYILGCFQPCLGAWRPVRWHSSSCPQGRLTRDQVRRDDIAGIPLL